MADKPLTKEAHMGLFSAFLDHVPEPAIHELSQDQFLVLLSAQCGLQYVNLQEHGSNIGALILMELLHPESNCEAVELTQAGRKRVAVGWFGYLPNVECEKPPLGLRPAQFVNDCEHIARPHEIVKAVIRYREAGKPIPMSWLRELEHLCYALYGPVRGPNDE